MSLGLKRNPKFHQGFFNPKNPDKYVGREIPIYRSGIELKFFQFCDDNANVLKWSSENIIIPYYDPVQKKVRKYYVDNFVEIKEGNEVKKYVIEIKDLKATKEPEPKKHKRKATLLYEQTTWITNSQGKWPAAMKFCKDNGFEFLLLGYSQSNGFERVPLSL